jgi:hypothetical protein
MHRDLYGADDLTQEQITEYLIKELHRGTHGKYRAGGTIPIRVTVGLIQGILEAVWQQAEELARQQCRD